MYSTCAEVGDVLGPDVALDAQHVVGAGAADGAGNEVEVVDLFQRQEAADGRRFGRGVARLVVIEVAVGVGPNHHVVAGRLGVAFSSSALCGPGEARHGALGGSEGDLLHQLSLTDSVETCSLLNFATR